MAVLLWLCFQDLERHVAELGAPEAERREAAAAALFAAGEAARPTLVRATSHPDPEVAGRARAVLLALDRDVRSLPRVLGALPADAPHRLLQQAAHAVRQRVLGKTWEDLADALRQAGVDVPPCATGWPDGEMRVPLRTRAVEGFDLVLAVEVDRWSSRAEPTRHRIREAWALLVLSPAGAEVSFLRRAFSPGSVYAAVCADKEFETAFRAWDRWTGMEISYRPFPEGEDGPPWGFTVEVEFGSSNGLNGSSLTYQVGSRLDAQPSADVLGALRRAGSGSWSTEPGGSARLLREGPVPPEPEAPERRVAYSPADLARLPDDVRVLSLLGPLFEDPDAALLARFTRLADLRLDNADEPSTPDDAGGRVSMPATDAFLKGVAKLPGLRRLHVTCPEVTDAGLAALAGLRNLERLSLDTVVKAGDEGLAAVLALPSLRELDLETMPALTGKTFERLGAHPGLHTLRLSHVSMKPEDLARLVRCRHLELSMVDLAEGTLARLADLQALETLQLGNSAPLRAEDVRALGALPALRDVFFWGQAPPRETLRSIAAAWPGRWTVK